MEHMSPEQVLMIMNQCPKEMSSYQEFKIGSVNAQPKTAQAYVRKTGSSGRHGENVSA